MTINWISDLERNTQCFSSMHYFPVTSTLECSFRDSLPNNDEAVQRLAWDVKGIIL